MRDLSKDIPPRQGDLPALLREGCVTLRALGQPELAREFHRRGRGLTSREALVELLLESLRAARER